MEHRILRKDNIQELPHKQWVVNLIAGDFVWLVKEQEFAQIMEGWLRAGIT